MTCIRCSLYQNCTTPCIQGEGDSNARLMLVGECPGFNEDQIGRPFVGLAGQLLDHVLNKLGLKRESIFITNFIRCRPVKNELPKGEELEKVTDACWPHLEKELQTINPSVVVLLGGAPLQALVGHRFITKHEGMEVDSVYQGARTFAALHPAFILRSPSKESNLARALYKAAKVAGMKLKTRGLESGFYEYELRG